MGPTAQFGLRFPLYVAAVVCAWIGLDAKGASDGGRSLILVVAMGLVLIAFPVFAMQKAIAMLPNMTLATVTALGPLAVLVLQLVEGRVAYAPATAMGLGIYVVGALSTAIGSTRPLTSDRSPSRAIR